MQRQRCKLGAAADTRNKDPSLERLATIVALYVHVLVVLSSINTCRGYTNNTMVYCTSRTFRQNETDILSRIVQLEREIGREPNLLDLLCRFSREEIDIARDSLNWLYPDLFCTVDRTTVPELVIV